MKKIFRRIVWKVKEVFGISEERKITVKSFLYHYPIFSEYKVYMNVYDPTEKVYSDVDEIFNSATATEEEYEKFYKRFGGHAISGISPTSEDEIDIDIDPTRKEEKTWYYNEYRRKNNSELY